MVTHTVQHGANATASPSTSFLGIAGMAALLAGIVGFLYALAFIVLKNTGLSALFLMLGGLLSTAVLVAVYERLRAVNAPVALWGLFLAGAGALGATIHGGYDLANALHPPSSTPDLPSAIDPRGLLTFGVTGLGLLVIAWLLGRDRHFPAGLSVLGYVTAVLLVILYLGRLIVLDAKSPVIVAPALLNGFIAYPAWYLWLGLALWRGGSQTSS